MNKFKKIVFVVFTSLMILSCGEDEDDSNCIETTSEFQSLFQSMISSGHSDEVTFDTEIHEYSFTLSVDKEICKIGYQSVEEIESVPYLIEIIDNTTNTSIYSDSHVFSSDKSSYVTPTSAINLKSNVSYTIKRIQTDWDPFISYTIGRIAKRDSMAFPYSNGDLTITGANFHQNGGPLIDRAIPYIDLIWK